MAPINTDICATTSSMNESCLDISFSDRATVFVWFRSRSILRVFKI